jgi:hypothetical protein
MDTDPKGPTKSGLGWIWWAVVIPVVVTILGGLAVEYLKPEKTGSNDRHDRELATKDGKQTVDKPGKLLHGPISGKLVWLGDNSIQWERAGVAVRDCVVQATSFNPYDAASAAWAEVLFFPNHVRFGGWPIPRGHRLIRGRPVGLRVR